MRLPHLLVLASAATIALGAVAPAHAATPEPLEYVALGDSFAAGYGLEPVTDEPVPGCAQAEEDYPRRVAAALELDLVDVTCAGAVTANLTDTPQETSDGTAPVQLDALSSTTDVVTVTIGGNDAGFTTVAASCVALTATGPVTGADGSFTSPDCRGIYVQDGVDTLQDVITTTVAANLATAYTAIRDRAPDAEVFVVSYPALLPSDGTGCFRPATGIDGAPSEVAAVPFTDTDVAYLAAFQQALDGAVRDAAASAGFTLVDAYAETVGHDLCSATPYVDGVLFTGTSSDDLELVAGSLHPNEAGVAALAELTTEAVSDLLPASATEPDDGAAPGLSPVTVGAGALAVGALVAIAALLVVGRRRQGSAR